MRACVCANKKPLLLTAAYGKMLLSLNVMTVFLFSFAVKRAICSQKTHFHYTGVTEIEQELWVDLKDHATDLGLVSVLQLNPLAER